MLGFFVSKVYLAGWVQGMCKEHTTQPNYNNAINARDLLDRHKRPILSRNERERTINGMGFIKAMVAGDDVGAGVGLLKAG